MLLFHTLLLLHKEVFCDECHISSANELISFSKNVSSGINYKGTTVLLDADIDFSDGLSEQFKPIGNSSSDFQGTFDGKGHTISNLVINSSLEYVGLFGYSGGATTRNVVLDSSCSVVSSYNNSTPVYAGGIIGRCEYCTIESCVNMASVAFTGNITDKGLFFGGIAGQLSFSHDNDITVKNCANYGSVTHSGTAGYSYIGGIVGLSSGSSSNNVFIQNCLNYGTITQSGTSKNTLYIGGISGYSSSGTNNLENCVSGGKITSNTANSYIGSVVGYINSEAIANITHCYWTSDVGNYNVCGSGNQTIDFETSLVSFNITTMDNLNSYNSSWSKWFMLHLNGGNINNLNQSSLIVTQKHFPDPVKEGNSFLFWCLDTECNEKYNPNTTDVTKVIELYAAWNTVTVRFDGNGGTPSQQTKEVAYGQKYGQFPETNRTGYTFLGWFYNKTNGNKITENDIVRKGFDHIIYAHWEANSYTVTLNPNGGNVSLYEITVVYGRTYCELPIPTKTNFHFSGWFTNEGFNGKPITNTTVVEIASNHTFYAWWLVTQIKSAIDFINFSNNMYNGANYKGTTVAIENDIDFSGNFSEQFKPVGAYYGHNNFYGSFDGQGHLIKNLVVVSAEFYFGLFGIVFNSTIKNVVIDPSCSFTINPTFTWSGIGSTVGLVVGKEKSTIENVINMANVTIIRSSSYLITGIGGIYGGNSEKEIDLSIKNCINYGLINLQGLSLQGYIGGISGICEGNCDIQDSVNFGPITNNNEYHGQFHIGGIGSCIGYCKFKNCVNYGKIETTKGINFFFVGGISGKIVGLSNKEAVLKNSANHGEVSVIGIVQYKSWIGGISGYTEFTFIDNCINGGTIPKIINVKSGIITGYYGNNTLISNCHWTKGDGDNLFGDKNGNTSVEALNVSLVQVSVDTLKTLNKEADKGSYNKWVILELNGGRVDGVSEERVITVGRTYPEPKKEGNTFLFWSEYEDCCPNCSRDESSGSTSANVLYAGWKRAIVTLSTSKEFGWKTFSVEYGNPYGEDVGDVVKGDNFCGWFTKENGEGEHIVKETKVIRAANHTLYAYMGTCYYILTFDFGNGTLVNETLKYNEKITYPNATKEGYTFNGWVPKPDKMPKNNITVVALWNKIIKSSSSSQSEIAVFVIEIVIDTKKIGDKDIETVIKKIIGDNINVRIEKVEEKEGTGDVIIIIKFVDSETDEATIIKFVDEIKKNEDIKDAISKVKVTDKDDKVITEEIMNDNSESSNNTAVVVAVVVVAFVAVSVLFTALAVFFMKRKQVMDIEMARRTMCSRVIEKNVETEDTRIYKSMFKHHKKTYPKGYKPPQSIKEALVNADMDEEDAEDVEDECVSNAESLRNKRLITEKFNVEDAAAVALYTFDFGKEKYDMNPYRLLNKALNTKRRKEKVKEVVKVRDILYLVMCALRKLPVVRGVTLYRGIRGKVELSQYKEGRTVTWPGFSSTTPDMNVTKTFMEKMTKDYKEDDEYANIKRNNNSDNNNNKNATIKGTMFIIEDARGYNIQPYSLFPDEKEILLEPERVFKVTSVVDSDGFLLITLKMLDTKPIFTKIFGKNK